MLPHAWYTICALIVIPIALGIAYCLPKRGGRRQPASQVCVRVLTPYPEPDWNQGKRWSPLGQPHPLTLVKVRWLGRVNNAAGSLSFGLSDCCPPYHPLYTCVTWNHIRCRYLDIFGDSVLDWMRGLVECK